jgi:hypothetical protein
MTIGIGFTAALAVWTGTAAPAPPPRPPGADVASDVATLLAHAAMRTRRGTTTNNRRKGFKTFNMDMYAETMIADFPNVILQHTSCRGGCT